MDCGQCKYFESVNADKRKGVCRLFPPVLSGGEWAWPVVKVSVPHKYSSNGDIKHVTIPGDWCGQFKKAP